MSSITTARIDVLRAMIRSHHLRLIKFFNSIPLGRVSTGSENKIKAKGRRGRTKLTKQCPSNTREIKDVDDFELFHLSLL